MAGFYRMLLLCNFIVLLFWLRQKVLFDGEKISENFHEVLLISFHSSSCVMCTFKKTFMFCNLLQLCGDIALNPGPQEITYPCATCSKAVTSRQRGIECSRCERWSHATCVNMSVAEYNALSEDVECPWHCPSCVTVVNESPSADASFTSD